MGSRIKKQMKLPENQNMKHVLISILIGAMMAFFSTLFQNLAELFKSHSQEIISGGVTASAYLFQKHIS